MKEEDAVIEITTILKQEERKNLLKTGGHAPGYITMGHSVPAT